MVLSDVAWPFLLSTSWSVTAPNLLGLQLSTDPTTEIWLFKSEI